MKDPTIAAYAKYAPQYQRMNGISIWNDALLRFKVYVPGGRVLDIGCGTGREYPHFPDPTYTYTGLDASAEMLAIARRNFPSADFQLTDIRHITIPPPTAATVRLLLASICISLRLNSETTLRRCNAC